MLVHQVSHCSINAIGRFRVATTVPRAVPAVTAARRASQRPRQLQPPRATPESEPNDDKEKGNKQAEKRRKRYAKIVEELQSTGMTPAKAKEVLRVWGELGARNAEELQQLLVKRSLAPVTALAVQSLLDFVACGGGFYIGRISGQADFPGSLLFSLLGYFMACYYFLQAAFQVTALVSLTAAAGRYRTDASLLLEAVRQLAGPGSGLSVVDTVSLVVNTLKVIQTLEAIGAQLKDVTPGDGGGTSLANLSALLTLQRAEEVYGFTPERYGLSEAQAADIAGVFSTFDANGDGQLELAELRTLCSRLGTDISEAEAREAVRLLDSGGTGFVSFDDFVQWYIGLKPSREAKDAAAGKQKASD